MMSTQCPLPAWNATARDFPRDALVHCLFEQQVARTPTAAAISFDDESLSYGELNRRANQLAHHLQSLGARPGVLVGISLQRSLDMVVAVIAVLKSGAAYVPLDPAYPTERLAFVLEDAASPILITSGASCAAIEPFAGEIVDIDDGPSVFRAQREDNPVCAARADDLAYVIYTSGSTGRPKGVQIAHRSVVNFLLSMHREPGMRSDDVVLAQASLSFDISVLDLFVPLTVGARVVIVPRDVATNGRRLLDLMTHSGATIMQATPSTWRMLIEAGLLPNPTLTAFVGGEALPMDLAQVLVRRLRALWNLYGPTETTVYSTLARYVEGKPLIGRPIANTRIHVLDEQLRAVPIGQTGELHIAGEGLAKGYLKRPDLTAEKFIPDPFSTDPSSRLYKTGDLARYDEAGNIECLGRIDHQVKIRGYRIELDEIETLLRQHPEVQDAVVIARPDVMGAQRLLAYVVGADSAPLDLAALKQHLLAHLPEFMVPRTIVPMDALPQTPNLKVDRNALPEPHIHVVGAVDEPRDEVEQALAEIWADTLGLPQVGIHQDFFDSGGHSLLALVTIKRVEEHFHTAVPLDALWANGCTVAGLAQIVRAAAAATQQSRLVRIRPGSEQQPLFVIHTARGSVNEYFALAHQLPAGQAVIGVRARGAMGEASPSATIEALAGDCIDAILDAQPQGPVMLAGFSLGGLIAYEIAVQLHRRGHRVSFLGLLDTVAPGFQPRFSLAERVVGGVRRRWLALLKTLAPAQPHDDSAAQLDERGVVSEYSSALQHLLLNAEMAYQPTAACPLPPDLFVAQDTARRAPEATLGWRAHSPAGVRRHYVASEYHLDIVSPLHASDVARALNACLARVRQEASMPDEPEPDLVQEVPERAERRA